MILAISISTYDVQAKNSVNNNQNEILTADEILQDKKMQKEIEDYLVKELGENYKLKLEKNEKSVKNAQNLEKEFVTDEKGSTIYPDYFGGMYIDKDDQLVVQIVKSKLSASDTEKYSKLINDANKEYVQYSYRELKDIHDKVLNYFLNDNKLVNITGVSIDVLSNRVIVELKEKSED